MDLVSIMRVSSCVAVVMLAAMSAPALSAQPSLSQAEDAATALVSGDAAQAVTSYTEALKDTSLSNDRRAALLSDRGVAYSKLGYARQAIEDFNLAAQLFPEYAAVYNNRGNLLLSLGLTEEALKDFDRSIVLAPGYAAAYNNRAGVLVRLGRIDEAVRDYTKAVELLPSNPAPLNGRGRAHLARMRPYAAMRDFTRAVNADARFAAGYRNRAEAKLEVEHFDGAVEDLSRAIAFDVNNAANYVLRGVAYLSVRNTQSAIKDFTQAIALDPKNVEAYAQRGFAYALAESYDTAFGDLNKAIEIDPRSGLAFAFRAYVYKQTDQLDVALRDMEVAEKLSPERAEVHWVRAGIVEAQGQTEQAIAHLKKALELRPAYRDAAEALQRLGSAPVTEESVIPGAGIDNWRVVARGGRYYALSELYPRLSVPLEMLGAGEPRLLEWELKPPPYKGIGLLRYFGGSVLGKSGSEDMELVAVVDVDANTVVAIEPHRLGDKVATWTWEQGKVVVATVDGSIDELVVRTAREVAFPGGTRSYRTDNETSTWAPWAEPWAGGAGASSGPVKRSSSKKRKPKTFFDFLFN